MHLPTVLIGTAATLYGTYTAWARATRPQQFAKLEAMKKSWGPTAGTAIHVIAYTVVPIGAGIAFVVTGLQGRSIF